MAINVPSFIIHQNNHYELNSYMREYEFEQLQDWTVRICFNISDCGNEQNDYLLVLHKTSEKWLANFQVQE